MLTRIELEFQRGVYRALDALDDLAAMLEQNPELVFTKEMADDRSSRS